jgi:hypothetical protein
VQRVVAVYEELYYVAVALVSQLQVSVYQVVDFAGLGLEPDLRVFYLLTDYLGAADHRAGPRATLPEGLPVRVYPQQRWRTFFHHSPNSTIIITFLAINR